MATQYIEYHDTAGESLHAFRVGRDSLFKEFQYIDIAIRLVLKTNRLILSLGKGARIHRMEGIVGNRRQLRTHLHR